MKVIFLDIKAALLYLEYRRRFNYNPHMNIGLECSDLITKIVELGYPDPTTVEYTDANVPFIDWRDDDFNCQDFYTCIGRNPTFYHVR